MKLLASLFCMLVIYEPVVFDNNCRQYTYSVRVLSCCFLLINALSCRSLSVDTGFISGDVVGQYIN